MRDHRRRRDWRKLELKRERLRVLDMGELRQVMGAGALHECGRALSRYCLDWTGDP